MANESTTQVGTEPKAAKTNNSIRPARHRMREKAAETAALPEPKEGSHGPRRRALPGTAERLIPDSIRQRFVQVGHRYYFSDGAHAFTDRGARLVTGSENAEVVKSLIRIAEARGWREISVTGTERFRKEAWAAASRLGITVKGYRPTEFERGQLARRLARDTEASPSGVEEPVPASRFAGVTRRAPPDRPELITGRLIDHGSATYRHDPHERVSYFVRIETPKGEREIWGIDLQRALRESLTQPKPGDEVGLRSVRQESVTVPQARRDATGNIVGQDPLATHRNRWIVERKEFFQERAAAARTLRDLAVNPKQAARRHPELIGTYLQVHAAELAARRFRDPQDRERFVSRVRSALADAVARGEPLPPVRLREKAAKITPAVGPLEIAEAPAR